MLESSIPELDESLVRGLLRADAFPHPAKDIQLIDTHISWVLLAGEFAYKIKKPLALGFLDFSSLQSRKFYCEEEIRLNKRWAPEIYLGVVKIVMDAGLAKVDAAGEPVEYAVRMRRFDQSLRLDKQLESGRLSAADMHELAANIAHRHTNAPRVPVDQRQHVLDLTESQMWDNFEPLQSVVPEGQLRELQDWTEKELQKRRGRVHERFDRGFFRDCHGDLHLANLVRLPSGITTFDCIEFSADLRHIDLICDIAFLVMDLESKGRDDLAALFINRYLERTGDYACMRLFDLYFVYRCMVRAKVAAIRARERESGCEQQQADLAEVARFCELALRRIRKRQPVLVVMHGLSGSGKTWISERLMAGLPAIRLRSDVQRRNLFGLEENQSSGSGVAQGIYADSAGARVYAQMLHYAETVLAAGHSVILDATFLQLAQRDGALAMATRVNVPAVIIKADAPLSELRRRIVARARRGQDASEADLPVLDHQLHSMESLTEAEQEMAVTINSRDSCAIDRMPELIRKRIATTCPRA